MTKNILKKIFAIDYRSLALFRMGVACCVIWDCIERLRDVRDFLSDEGVVPVALYHQYRIIYAGFSIYSWNGSELWATSLLVFTILLALGLFWGKRYPVTLAALSWFMNVSLHHRNPFTMFGGDALLQVCLFWLMFLPLNGPTDKEEKSFSNGASIALFLQIAIIYIGSGWQKDGPDWHEGTAVFYALSIGMYETATGDWLKQFPLLLKMATFTVLWTERLAWGLIFIPSKGAWARSLAFFILAGMHWTFIFGLKLHFFPWIDISLLCLVIPTELWAKIGQYRIPFPKVRLATRPHYSWISGLAVFFVIWFALLNLQVAGKLKLPEWSEKAAVFVRFHQGWQLFSPSPYHFSNWFVTEIENRAGEKRIVKIHGFGSNSFTRPPEVADTYPTLDWLRYYPVLMATRRATRTVRRFGVFICQVLNREDNLHVQKFNFYIVRATTLPERTIASEIKPENFKVDLLLHGDCTRSDFETHRIHWEQ